MAPFATDSAPASDTPYRLVVTSAGRLCDANDDEHVDRLDIEAIFDARGALAYGPADLRDANGDGRVTVGDGRLCQQACDLPSCAIPACGLLGPELLIPLWPLLARTRRRPAAAEVAR